MTNIKAEKGFTLVELSIVIVIIGLIVAGVVAGQSLVKQAKIRQVISDYNKIKVAVNAFKLEYNALPGDMDNAFDYWGAAIGCTDVYVNTNVNGCNGNGDKDAGDNRERIRFWHHLEQADLWNENLTRPQAGLPGPFVPGVDMPAGPFPNSGYSLGLGDGSIRFGNYVPGQNLNNGPALSPPDAYTIDLKIDDGLPQNGNLIGRNANPGTGAVTCFTAGNYDLTVDKNESRCWIDYHGII